MRPLLGVYLGVTVAGSAGSWAANTELASLLQDSPTVVVEDLRLCTVKHCEDIERRFCFEVVSPTK